MNDTPNVQLLVHSTRLLVIVRTVGASIDECLPSPFVSHARHSFYNRRCSFFPLLWQTAVPRDPSDIEVAINFCSSSCWYPQPPIAGDQLCVAGTKNLSTSPPVLLRVSASRFSSIGSVVNSFALMSRCLSTGELALSTPFIYLRFMAVLRLHPLVTCVRSWEYRY